MEETVKTSSHKKETIKSYTLKFKLDVISYAETHGKHAAERKYKIDRKRIREWRQKKQAFNKLLIPRKQKEANENVWMGQEESHSEKHWMNLFSNGSTRDVQKDFLYQGNSSWRKPY